ncbi:MAG: PD40 domain-containing protein [Phycisphaerales bacterium]|nr:PD40 domain-containing protein [Phycisphaerales bacterium]
MSRYLTVSCFVVLGAGIHGISLPTVSAQDSCGCGMPGLPGMTAPWRSPGQEGEEKQGAGGQEANPEDEKKADDDKKPKWDVADPPLGPSKDVAIDTTEGTWMSLDVSPDGTQLVFDMLGDLFIMPIAGGEAKALTTGLPWDMQPRFSPDGKQIAFTSDRGGGDNIWVMNRDGSDAKQVTKETFRLLNQPSWSPDGQFIVARKHFTSRRSLGAGEMWLYHVTGGDGLQMTRKPNDQKDVGEPVFSPDGRYLYYSQDATPGDTFQYNKDSNGQIYVVFRLDREKGETEGFITGPGGACCPTPSPDGKLIAFVRRVRFQTCLFLRDVASGREWPLYEHLDRDMQETWAVHGVYPRMAWTPDNKSVVFWAGGKIQRIDVASKQVADIPFHVKATQKVFDALRFPVQVHPEEFDVKVLRWVQVSPAGDKVVYQALGRLYVADVEEKSKRQDDESRNAENRNDESRNAAEAGPSPQDSDLLAIKGAPRRLTKQDDHFEFYPSFSRDGKWIVYTTWKDGAYGAVKMVPSVGGTGRTLTPEAGHYVEPAFTPDGNHVVFRKIPGDLLRGQIWSRDPGVYVIGIDGNGMKLVTKKGTDPMFGASGDRVFLTHVESKDDKDRRMLISIELDGSDERTHLVSENAVEYRISPDEKWIAWVEKFNVHLAPFVRTGKEVEIGPKSKALPIAKVSRDAGLFLHWSGDSTKLHWAYGPELFTRDLKEAFAFLPGAPEKLPEAPTSGVNLAFKQKSDIPDGKLAFTGARIITMKGDEVIEGGTIVVDRNRIVAVGPSAQVQIPADATKIDAGGCTIMPGMIDVHAHGPQGSEGFTPQQNWSHYANLAFGVTTIHDPSNDTYTIFSAAELARAGMIVSPRTFSTGTILYGAAGSFKADVDSLDDAKSHLRRMQAIGAFSVKSYNQPRRDQRQQVIAAARELGMMVVPEGGSLYMHNMSMILDGHTGIEHNIPVARAYNDALTLWSSSSTGYTPTLVVCYGGMSGEYYWYQHTDVWANERLMSFVPRDIVDPRSRRRQMAPEEEYNHVRASQVCKALTDRGVKVNLGAHGQLAGLGAHWELWMFVQGGMTPMQALRCVTMNGAHYVGLAGDLGSLQPGKLADFLVLEKNPLEDIRNSENIRQTVLNGRVYDAKTMNEIAPQQRPRGKFFWEE